MESNAIRPMGIAAWGLALVLSMAGSAFARAGAALADAAENGDRAAVRTLLKRG